MPVVVLPVLVYVVSERQQPLYEASAQVLLNHQDQVATTLVGVQTPQEDAGRYAVTQTLVASTPALARRVLDAVGLTKRPAKDLIDHASFTSNADVLVFSVRNHDAALTARLAGAYAREYTAYRRQLDTRELSQTVRQLEQKVTALARRGAASSRLYASLLAKEQDVRLLQALRQANVYVIRTPTASDVDQIAPRPLKNTAVTFAVALMLGVIAAFLADALDTRVRSADELEEGLALPLLAAVPPPRGRADGRRVLAVLADGESHEADAFLALRARLALANVDVQARTVLFASAGAQEGSATVAANLGATMARAGSRVVVADLDLRASHLTRLFELDERPGLTAVVVGETTLDDALTPVSVLAGAGREPAEGGSLHVLASGARPPRPGELVASAPVAAVLAELRAKADLVLVVAPPLLDAGDAISLGGGVDALVLVARLGALRRTRLRELRRLLASWPGATLGFVLTGAASPSSRAGGSGTRWRRLAAALRSAPSWAAPLRRPRGAERAAESWP